MIYVDASVIVAALTPEENTTRAYAWLTERPRGSLGFSGWVVTEVSSALARKVRIGTLSGGERDRILHDWRHLRTDSFISLPVPVGAFEEAARLIDYPRSVLRAGDALHLAIASLGGHGLATFDAQLAEAATRAGVPVSRIE